MVGAAASVHFSRGSHINGRRVDAIVCGMCAEYYLATFVLHLVAKNLHI